MRAQLKIPTQKAFGLYPSPVIAEEEIPSELTWVSNLPFEFAFHLTISSEFILPQPLSLFFLKFCSSACRFFPLSLGLIPCVLV